MATQVIDIYTGINSIGDLSNNLIDPFTNLNSVSSGGGGTTEAGLGLYKVGNFLNIGVDNSTIQINGSNLLEIKNSFITFTSTDGITPVGNVSLGGSVTLNVDSTVIRTNKTYQEISGNIKIGDGTNSSNFSTGSLIIDGGLGVNGNINSSGQVTATRLCSSSDKRLKKDINPLENCLSKINEIDAFSYKWRKRKGQKRDNLLNYGVIAQQLEEIGLEHMVMTSEENYKSVSYTQLIPMLIGSVKELTNKIEELEKKINK
jgi:hypothetical protein